MDPTQCQSFMQVCFPFLSQNRHTSRNGHSDHISSNTSSTRDTNNTDLTHRNSNDSYIYGAPGGTTGPRFGSDVASPSFKRTYLSISAMLSNSNAHGTHPRTFFISESFGNDCESSSKI